MLEDDGRLVEDYAGSAAFLAAFEAGRPGRNACLLVDAEMPSINGLELLEQLAATGHALPVIVITGHGDVAMAVRAMKAGALDFIEIPVRAPELLASVAHALDHSRDADAQAARHATAAASIASLTPRQRDVMAMVLAGHPSKNIAADLGISQRTSREPPGLHHAKDRRALAASACAARAGRWPAGQGRITPVDRVASYRLDYSHEAKTEDRSPGVTRLRTGTALCGSGGRSGVVNAGGLRHSQAACP